MPRTRSSNPASSFDFEYLRKLGALKGLPTRKVQAMLDMMTICQFARRSIIYRDDQAPKAYLMLSGVAKLTCLNRRGRRNLLEVLGPGDMIEIPSLLPDYHHFVSCDAFTDCQVGIFNPRDLVERAVGISFRGFRQALNLTVERWWYLLERQSRLLNQSVDERVALALTDMSAKFGVKDDRGVIINLALTHQDVAELVDCSRPKVSQCIRRLAEAGVLIREPRRLVVNRTRLHEILRPTFTGR